MHAAAKLLYKGTQGDLQILDSRPASTFCGGNIKNSINVPFMNMLSKDGTMKSEADLVSVFE
jgi:3-mercaptopyruvate sulfurtransferase SseA